MGTSPKAFFYLKLFQSKIVFRALFLWSFFFSIPSWGAPPSGIISLTVEARHYSRASSSVVGSEAINFGVVPEASIQLRLMPSWFLKVSHFSSSTAQLAGTSAGLRIAMPGFFLMGNASEGDLIKRRRSRLAETSLHVELFQVQDLAESSYGLKFFSPRGMFVVDWRLGRNTGFFLVNDLALQSLRGNLYASVGIGLGIEF